MINNKRLLYALITLIPIVVISFISKNKTNFILEERKAPLTVKVLYNGDVLNIELEEYVRGVVAGEMRNGSPKSTSCRK